MNTSNLTKGSAWKDAGKTFAGILVGMVAANQIQKLLKDSIYVSGGLFVVGGAGSILTSGFLKDVSMGVATFGGLKTIAKVGAMSKTPAFLAKGINSFVPSLAGIGAQPLLLNPGGYSPYAQATPVDAMNGGNGGGITTDVTQMS